MTTEEHKDECVRIVEELGKHLDGKPDVPMNSHAALSGVRDRILAAVKPKGSWPVAICNNAWIDLEDEGVRIYTEYQEIFGDSDGMDRLVVAWLKHRGVDAARVSHFLNYLAKWDEPFPDAGECSANFQAILDNAEAG